MCVIHCKQISEVLGTQSALQTKKTNKEQTQTNKHHHDGSVVALLTAYGRYLK